MLCRAGCCPCDVVADRRGYARRREELEIIEHGSVLYIERHSLIFDFKRIVGNLYDPEQTGGLDAAIEVVQLHGEARTGLVEVNSNKGKRASVMRAIRGHVFASEHSHVCH